MTGQESQSVTPQPRQVSLDEYEEMVRKGKPGQREIPKALWEGMKSQESGGDVNATSATGVRGRWQVTQATAKQYGYNRDDPFEQAAAAGTHLRKMFDASPGQDDSAKWWSAVAKYYGGDSAVDANGNLNSSSRDGVSNPVQHISRVRKYVEQYRAQDSQPQQPAKQYANGALIPPPTVIRSEPKTADHPAYEVGIGWPQFDAKGRPYKPVAPDIEEMNAQGRANTERYMAAQEKPAVVYRRQPRPTSNVFSRAQQQAGEQARGAFEFNREGAVAQTQQDLNSVNKQISIDPKLRAQADSYAAKPLAAQMVEDIYQGMARGGQQIQEAGQRVIGTVLGAAKTAAVPVPFKPVDIRSQKAQAAQEQTAQNLEFHRRASGDPITGEIASALPVVAGATLAGTAGGLPALAGYNAGLEDWQDPKRSALRVAANTLIPVGAAKVAGKVAAPIIDRIASPTARTLANVATEAISGGTTNAAQTAAEQAYFDGRVDPNAVIRSGVVGAGIGGAMAAGHPEAGPSQRQQVEEIASRAQDRPGIGGTTITSLEGGFGRDAAAQPALARQAAMQAARERASQGTATSEDIALLSQIDSSIPLRPEKPIQQRQREIPTAEDITLQRDSDAIAKAADVAVREDLLSRQPLEDARNEIGKASGLLDAAEHGWDADRPSAEIFADEGVKRLKGALQNLQNSPDYQAELSAAAEGRALPEAPHTATAQTIKEQLTRAETLANRDAEIQRQTIAAEKLQKKAAKEEVRQSRIQLHQEARRQKQEDAKAARRVELETQRQNAQNERQARIAEAELQRIASHDAALKAADDAGRRSIQHHAEGRTSEAINELIVQQNQIRDAVKYLPRTPEAQSTKADLNRYSGQIGNRIGDLRREARGVRGRPVTEAIPPLLRPEATVNPGGGIPEAQSFYTPGAGFERLAAEQRQATDQQPSLLAAIRRMGGIRDDGDTSGELRRLGIKESGTSGLVNNRSGVSPDRVREQLAEDGYLPHDSTVDDLYQAIEGEMRAGQKRSREESIDDYYQRQAAEGAGRREDGESDTPAVNPPQLESVAQGIDPEDLAAYRRAIDRSFKDNPRNYGERTRPGEPGSSGKSLSGFNTMLSRNGEKIDRLRKMNLNSPEAQQIIEEIRADNEKMAIEINRRHLTPHLDELLTMIKSDQFTALAERDSALHDHVIEEARDLPGDDKIAIEREVAAIDVAFEDVDTLDLLVRAVKGDDSAYKDFLELATEYYGIQQETASDLVRNRKADRDRQSAYRQRPAKVESQNGGTPDRAESSESAKSQKLTDRERQLLNLKPDDIFDDRFDDYMAAIEDIHARAVRGEVDIDPQTIHDSTRWIGSSPEEVEARKAAGEKAPILNRIHGARSARVEENRLPARENLEVINKYINADLSSLAEPPRANRMSRLDEIIKAARITTEKNPSGVSADWMAKVRDLLERAQAVRDQYLKSKSGEVRMVSHPDPAIDGKKIIHEREDGRVVVANPENKSGISVVKDRSAEISSGDSPHEFSSTQVNLSGSIAEKIADFARRIPDADLADDGREDQPHITVKYGLHGDNADEVRTALAGEKPIKVTFGKVSLFKTNDDYDVVKVDIDSPDLHRLNKKIAELPHTDTFPDYKPHATIAYVKKGKGEAYEGSRFLNGQVVRLNSMVFSDKNRNQVEIQLGGKATETHTKTTEPQSAILNPLSSTAITVDQIAKPKVVEEAEKRLADYRSGKQMGGGQQLFDQAIVTGHRIYRAGMEFGPWARAVIKEIGDKVRPHLRAAWEKLNEAGFSVGKLADEPGGPVLGALGGGMQDAFSKQKSKAQEEKPETQKQERPSLRNITMDSLRSGGAPADLPSNRSAMKSPVNEKRSQVAPGREKTADDYFNEQMAKSPIDPKADKTGEKIRDKARKAVQDAADRVKLGKLSDEHADNIKIAADALLVAGRLGDASVIRQAQKELAIAQEASSSPLDRRVKQAVRIGLHPVSAVQTAVFGSDFSFIGRQGAPLTFNPLNVFNTARAFKHLYDATGREGAKPEGKLGAFSRFLPGAKGAEAVRKQLESHPRFDLANRAGLELALTSHPEEIYQDNVISKLPWVKRMEAGNEAFLDYMRLQEFGKYADVIDRSGRTEAQKADAYQRSAAIVNDLTGRTNLGEGKIKALAEATNGLLSSPRLNVSHIKLLDPTRIFREMRRNPEVGKQMLLDATATMSALGGMMALGNYTGMWSVSMNPDDSDFLKFRIGNTRYDPGFGELPLIRMFWKAGKAFYKIEEDVRLNSAQSDKERKEASEESVRSLKNWAEGRLGPLPSYVKDIWTGKDFLGRPVKLRQALEPSNPNSPYRRLLLPASTGNIGSAIANKNPMEFIRTVPTEMIGIGTNTFEKGAKARAASRSSSKANRRDMFAP